jgi:hypothetical protein
MDAMKQFPHCDERVLHAPSECEYCDRHPDWQALRDTWRVAFTGHPPAEGETACPSDATRGLAGAHVWGGNRPYVAGGVVPSWWNTTGSLRVEELDAEPPPRNRWLGWLNR